MKKHLVGLFPALKHASAQRTYSSRPAIAVGIFATARRAKTGIETDIVFSGYSKDYPSE